VLAVAQANADSISQGFLSKYNLRGADASQTSASDYNKLITPNFQHKTGSKTIPHGLAKDDLDLTHPTAISHGLAKDDLDLSLPAAQEHGAAQVRKESMAFTSASAQPVISTQDLEPSKIAEREEQQSVQKLLGSFDNMPIILLAIGVALLSLATVVGVRIRRGLQSASVRSDMSVAMAPASGDNNMELKAQTETTPMPAEHFNGTGRRSARREFISTVAGAAGAAVATPALADVDYAGLPYLGGSAKIDINNANVRVYAKLPGMYPGAAGKIVTNGPYKSVSDIYNIKGISEAEKAAVKKYESRLIVLEPSAMYVIDRVNNGLYR
jgi:photosystem II PsbU protein